MKNIVFTPLLCLLFSFHANCQTEKGKFLVGGTLSGSYKQRSGPGPSQSIKVVSINLNPKVGYFIAKNLALGVSIGYGITHDNVFETDDPSGNYSKYHYTTLSADPFVRYYLLRKDKIGLFAEAAAGITYSGYTDSNANSAQGSAPVTDSYKFHSDFLNYSLGLGGNYFISDKVAFELNLNYQHFSYNDNNTPALFYRNNVNCSVGLMLFL